MTNGSERAEVQLDRSAYRHIEVMPVTGSIGAEIGGVDLGRELAEPVKAELDRALAQFHVLFFRDQTLDEDSVLRAAQQFGEPGNARLANRDGHLPLVSKMVREAAAPDGARVAGDR